MQTTCSPTTQDGGGQSVRRSRGKSAQERLPQDLLSVLQRHFDPRHVEYIARGLSADELRVVADLKDSLIIARIKRMPLSRLKRFDKFVPKDKATHKAYTATEVTWLRDEEYLLGTRLGRSPTQSELFRDFMSNHHGLRFRAYFTMKHPDRMVKRGRAGT